MPPARPSEGDSTSRLTLVLEAMLDEATLARIHVEDAEDAALADSEMPLTDGWTAAQREEFVASWRFGRRFWAAAPEPEPDESGGDWRERTMAFHREIGMPCPVVFPGATRGHVGPDLSAMTRAQCERFLGDPRSRPARGGSMHERDVASARAAAFAWRCAREGTTAAMRVTPRRRGAGRPRAPRRSGSSSCTSGADPGDDGGEPEPPDLALQLGGLYVGGLT